MFELQLKYAATGQPVVSDKAAASVAVALREALAELIGIENREIGWASVPSRDPESGAQIQSIVLYDTAAGGAGFVAQAATHLPKLLRRARALLRCDRMCDKACHACLLTADTWFSVERMDRHAALQVLDDLFEAGLSLPSEHRIFGNATQVEFEPFVPALQRVLRGMSARRVRLHLGGDPAEWELDRWPLHSALKRWSSEGIDIELSVRADVLAGIDASMRNQLAGLAESGIAQILEVPSNSSDVNQGAVIAELESDYGRTVFGVLAPDALTPGADWGSGTFGTLLVRASGGTEEFVLSVSPKVRAPETLRSLPEGTVIGIEIVQQLDGNVRGFGERFWDTVLAATPELGQRLSSEAAIAAVEYRDRYVRTPLAMRLLVEVLRELKKRSGKGMGPAMSRLVTIPMDQPNWNGRLVTDNWDESVDRGTIFSVAMANAGLRGELLVLPTRRDAAHARELEIEWGDGVRWKMRLDEGLGFMTAKRERHDFSAAEDQQGRTLPNAVYQVEARTRTSFYVGALLRGR